LLLLRLPGRRLLDREILTADGTDHAASGATEDWHKEDRDLVSDIALYELATSPALGAIAAPSDLPPGTGWAFVRFPKSSHMVASA
jgi:hypothetical protein